MSLNNIKNMKKSDGFTIVELLIVIVVIGILAAITIVAYNGVQKRANAAAAQSAANTLVKKAEAYNSISSKYPTSTTDFNAVAESSLNGANVFLTAASAAPTSTNGKTTIKYEVCGTTGARVNYFDYNAGSGTVQILLGDATAAMANPGACANAS